MKVHYFILLTLLTLLSCEREYNNLADPAVSFPKPSGLTISRVNESTLVLRWEYQHIGEDGFKIEQSENDSWDLRNSILYNKNEKYEETIINLPPGKYKFRVYGYFRQRNSECIEKEWIQLDYPKISISDNKTTVFVTDTVTKVHFFTADTLYKEKGVCWSSKTQGATLKDSYLKMSTDSISISKLNLAPHTMYYIRAYVTNYIDTVYSKEYKSMQTERGVPFPITTTPKDITNISARVGGDATNDGGYSISERGICYGTDSTTNQKIKCLNSTVYDTLIVNLLGNTTYYVKAYAVNEKGTGYGEIKSFKTLPAVLPKVGAVKISNISYSSATCASDVINDGGATIAKCGICYSKTPQPTTNDFIVNATPRVGSFNVNITELTGNTDYYIRAYATNSQGTSYSEEVKQFRTLAPVAPIIQTLSVDNIGSRSAKTNVVISDNGGAVITQSGICWGITNDPTITQNTGMTTNGPLVVGNFIHPINNLSDTTVYYARAYAKNQSGLMGYGTSVKFTTRTPWHQKADFQGTARNSVISFSINNIGYVGLGTNDMADNDKRSKNTEWYDDLWGFDGTKWEQKASITGARDAAISFVIGTDAYVGLGWGGSTVYSDLWKYNSITNAWTKMADFTGGARGRSVGFSVSGKGYISTGATSTSLFNDTWEYTSNAGIGAWVKKGNIPTQREGAVAFTIGTKAYMGLGYYNSTDFKDFYEYNSANGTWAKIDDFPGNARNGAVAFVINGRAYVGLGWNGTNYLDFYEFNPSASAGQRWAKMCNFRGLARGRAAVFTINNKAYIGLGTHDITQPALKDMWEYNPTLDY